MTLQLRYVSHSEIGLIRKNNQDSGYASPHLLVVADGMGGAAAGDLASAVAIDTLRRIEGPTSGPEMLRVLGDAIHEANDRIADLVEADLTLDGMGTTLTGALFDGAELGLVHIGDSRAYLLRDGELTQLTHDHSWVQSLVDEGKIGADEAAVHPHRSLLLKVLNGQPSNEPDLAMVSIRAGDRLMFCSDGVCGLLEDTDIAAALALPTLDEALEDLVSGALAQGGIDNITAIVADVAEATPAAGVESDAVGSVLGAAAERRIPAVGRPGGPPGEALAADDPMGQGESGDSSAADDSEDTIISARTAAAPASVDEERYTPRAPDRRRRLRPLAGLLVLVLIAAAGLGTAYAWTRTQYFVGADGDRVAIFQGLSDSFPGLQLAQVYEVQQLSVSELPLFYQEKVRSSIDVASLDAARQTVTELREAAERCAGGPPTPTPSPSPTGKPPESASPTTPAATTPAATTPAATVPPGPGC